MFDNIFNLKIYIKNIIIIIYKVKNMKQKKHNFCIQQECGSDLSVPDIVGLLAKHKFVESIVNKYTADDTADDLAQDIYIQLLTSEKTKELYLSKQLQFYIVGVVSRSIHSNSSPYFKKYINFKKISVSIDEAKNI